MSARTLSKKITKVHGPPNRVCKDDKGRLVFKEWLHIEGLDGIIVMYYTRYKWHPVPAPVYVYAYKYLHVPELLIGPLKYASETIKIDEIDIPLAASKKYYKTGEKKVAKVTGSCASITISAITIKFVEDMVKKYKNVKIPQLPELYKTFRKEYDSRIETFINTKIVTIPWFTQESESL